MRRADLLWSGLLPGAAGGVAGGLVFGAAMLDLGSLPSVASIVRVESEAAGFAVNMAIAATVGSGLGLLVWHQRPGLGETLLWGMAYGTLWWFIGTLTLHPLFLGDAVRWDAESAQTGLPALLGHILFGATAGLTIVLWRLGSVYRRQMVRPSLWALVRGGLASLLAVWMAGTVLAAQGQFHLFVAGTPDDARALVWLMTVLVGLLAGIGFALLYPRPTESAGAGLIRGAMYGFLWWVAAPLSVLPVLDGSELPWHLDGVREVFQTLPAYLLFGAAMSVFYQWLGVLARLLFSDAVPGPGNEGVGTQGLLALARGVVAGFIGGLVFTGIMVKTGALGDVSELIRVSSPTTGFFVHLVIANIVGASYGLLFRGQSYDVGSALGWGVTYGFLWWIIGTLTLMPVLLGSTPVWTAEVAAGVFPFLIGHLGYGAGLGIVFYLLEAQYRPWWVPRRQAQVALVARRKEQVMTSAPALWTLVVVISLTLPVLLSSGDIPSVQEPIY